MVLPVCEGFKVIDTKTPRTDAEATLSCDFGLRSAFVVHVEFARELEREIERIRAERDEARRMVCTVESALIGGRRTQRAESHGWDCFKENQ
jgi:hypothetical protein